ncbi:MAG TPA: cytochrome c-type biogenesis protein [Steroidobacteraceae bacterium]|jgi:cytochrome c-type biogenesis protein CcmH|nr:cytochrome c-type biogenesis protein [Steroidobacteraceae bacterium]
MSARTVSIFIVAFMAAVLLGASAAYAIAPEQMPTPQLEARYLALIQGFRCMQCQDESLADSPVDLAADMRRQIRDMLFAGKSDQQIRDFMVSRYGYFILFKPPFVAKTAWLWLTPGVLLLVGVIAAVRVIRQRAALAATDIEDNDLTDV